MTHFFMNTFFMFMLHMLAQSGFKNRGVTALLAGVVGLLVHVLLVFKQLEFRGKIQLTMLTLKFFMVLLDLLVWKVNTLINNKIKYV